MHWIGNDIVYVESAKVTGLAYNAVLFVCCTNHIRSASVFAVVELRCKENTTEGLSLHELCHATSILPDSLTLQSSHKPVTFLYSRPGPCPVSERLAKQKFSTWGFPINTNEAEIFFA